MRDSPTHTPTHANQADTLQSGAIAGAALDVFQQEPLDPSSRLWDCANLLVTAHNADYTDDYFVLGACVCACVRTCVRAGGWLVRPSTWR